MTTQQIFDHFNIPPGLQKHMYLVAGVGKYICDNWTGDKIKKHEVVSALLIHDLGNLIKFDLSPGAKIYDPILDSDEWRNNQQQLIKKYGPDEHQASLLMAKEVTNNQVILDLINYMDATNMEKTYQKTWEEKICEYADMRITPSGITSLADRFDDLHQRYKNYSKIWADEKLLAKNKEFGHKIEQQLQTNTTVDIKNISPEKIATYLVELPSYQI